MLFLFVMEILAQIYTKAEAGLEDKYLKLRDKYQIKSDSKTGKSTKDIRSTA